MVYQLLSTCRNFGAIANSSAIAIILLLTNTSAASSREYVFTAPPEVNRQIVEIPARDTEYPLYECNAKTVAEEDRALDAHDCSCTDCEEIEESKPEPSASTLKTQVEQP